MGIASFPLTKISNRMLSNSLPLIHKARTTPYTPCLNLKNNHHLPLMYQGLIKGTFSPNHEGTTLVAFGAKNSASGEGDKKALETVLKLYTALRNRNITELSEVIGDECRCVSNFISIFQPFHGKKEVLDFFSTLMDFLGKHIEFVVQPTLHKGMNVGVTWTLVWKPTHVPLGKGFSYYMCNSYKGRVMIRNVEMFMEPLLHVEPLILKLMGFVMTAMGKIGVFKGKVKKRQIYLLVAIVLISLMTAFLFII